MADPKIELTMYEEAGVMGQPIESPRRIVKLKHCGRESTYFVPSGGPPVILISVKHIPHDDFWDMWLDIGGEQVKL